MCKPISKAAPEIRQIHLPERKDSKNTQKFVPGGIHKSSTQEFWRDELKASSWVLDVLDNGYVIPFTEPPPIYEEDNNGSAKNNMEFVRQAVQELVEQGVVEIVSKKPRCVSPLTVASRDLPDGSKKLRLCWDGSRCINLLLKEQPVKLAHFTRALEITKQNDFQIKYDLKSAFHHIKIHKAQVDFLGAAFINKKGERIYFIFLYLPFGLSTAVHVITKLFKPLNAYFHLNNIRHTIYIDDGRGLADTKEEAEENRQFIYTALQKSGWTIETHKSDQEGQASQIKEYLGFIIDTQQMTVRLTKDKQQELKNLMITTISNGTQKKIQAKTLAQVLGKLVSTEPALGSMPIMTARAGYAQLEETTNKNGWNATLNLNEDTLAALQFFLENFKQFDNTPFRTDNNTVSVLSIIGQPSNFIKSSFIKNHTRFDNEEIWASDASGFATCTYAVKGQKMYFRGKLTEQEQKLSSGHRELLAVRHTLENFHRENSKDILHIFWLTDSENLTRFLTKGSSKRHVQRDIFRIMTICQRTSIRITPIHLLRDDPRIQIADQGSKNKDSDSWGVDFQTFNHFNSLYNFTIDLFASDRNTKCKKFYSNFYCDNTSGVEAFIHNWDGEVAWACPPVSLIIPTIRKILRCTSEGVLLVPEWPTADFWNSIYDKKCCLKFPFLKAEVCQPFIIQDDPQPKSPFRGHTQFNFLALFYSTNAAQ